MARPPRVYAASFSIPLKIGPPPVQNSKIKLEFSSETTEDQGTGRGEYRARRDEHGSA